MVGVEALVVNLDSLEELVFVEGKISGLGEVTLAHGAALVFFREPLVDALLMEYVVTRQHTADALVFYGLEAD